MSSEVIVEKVDISANDSGDSNSSIVNNNNEGGGSKGGVSALHDLIAGGVAGSMSVIVGRKFFIYVFDVSCCNILYYVHIICDK